MTISNCSLESKVFSELCYLECTLEKTKSGEVITLAISLARHSDQLQRRFNWYLNETGVFETP